MQVELAKSDPEFFLDETSVVNMGDHNHIFLKSGMESHCLRLFPAATESELSPVQGEMRTDVKTGQVQVQECMGQVQTEISSACEISSPLTAGKRANILL